MAVRILGKDSIERGCGGKENVKGDVMVRLRPK
jgi:hypothetical protein